MLVDLITLQITYKQGESLSSPLLLPQAQALNKLNVIHSRPKHITIQT